MVLFKKCLLVMMLLVVVVVALFSGLKVSKAFDGEIKIGIFAPMDPWLPYWYAGYYPAAELAAKQINDSGGILMGGKRYAIVLGYAHEPYDVETNPNWQTITVQSIHYLADPDKFNADIIVGGFNTECVAVAIDELMSLSQSGYTVPFFICGAPTNELLNPVHNGYDHLYRVTFNSTTLLRTLSAAVKYYLCSDDGILTRLFGVERWPGGPKQVRTAVVMEDLEWTLTMWYYLTNPAIYPSLLGPHVNVTFCYRLSPSATSEQVQAVIQGIKYENCSLLLHVFSAPIGVPFIGYWSAMQAQCLPVGINWTSQAKEMWTWTNGGCEYESHLMTMGTRTPMTPELEKFWDDFLNFTGGEWPVDTAVATYNTIYMLKEAIETIDTLDPEILHQYLCPLSNPWYEYQALNGKFKFTPSHDVFCNEFGPTWTQGYVRPMMCQWLNARLEVVYPIDQPYSKPWCLPPWMYTLIWDVNYDGRVWVDDLLIVYAALDSYPGHPRWNPICDFNRDSRVDMLDLTQVYLAMGGSPQNIAVTEVSVSRTVVSQGYGFNVHVTVENHGDFPQNVTLAINFDSNQAKTDTFSLSPGIPKTVTLKVVPKAFLFEEIWRQNYISTSNVRNFNLYGSGTFLNATSCNINCGNFSLPGGIIDLYYSNGALIRHFEEIIPPFHGDNAGFTAGKYGEGLYILGTTAGSLILLDDNGELGRLTVGTTPVTDIQIEGPNITVTTENEIILLRRRSMDFTLQEGFYTISAYAWPVLGETEVADNTYGDGVVWVRWPYDVTGDGYCGGNDIVFVAKHFGTRPGDPNWNPIYDINCDNYVGGDDIVIVAKHFGARHP